MRSTSLTIDTPASSYDLTTVAIAKEELDIGDAQYDGMLARWISETSILLAAACNRTFGLETVTEVFTSYRRPVRGPLRLSRYPVATLIAITDSADTDLTAEFRLDAEGGLIGGRVAPSDWFDRNFDQSWDWPFVDLSVHYSGGYDLPGSVPLPLQQACLTMLKHRWSARTRDPSLRAIDIPGVVSKTFWVSSNADGLPPEVQQLLDAYTDRGL
jgi:hypothetical protein